MKKITKIERKLPQIKKRKRVAAYARVSSEHDNLLHSLSSQVSYYSSLIQNNPEWEYVGVYADKGITGTSMEKRVQFNQLMADCDAGKIDMILVKSISRFARNTVDLLTTIRHLKDIEVAVEFEREHINSLTEDGELMLTLLASFAQEESLSISKNIKWAIQNGYKKGKCHVKCRAYGYEWDYDKNCYRIVPEESVWVKYIFEQYLSGTSLNHIAKELEAKGIVGVNGNPMTRVTLKGMIHNELYIGNMVLQKFYSPTIRKKARNYGQLPRYVVENTHNAIISKDLFDAVQKKCTIRAEEATNKDYVPTCFSGKVICAKCGYHCSRRQQEYWKCNNREVNGLKACDFRTITENELIRLSTKVLNMEHWDEKEFLKQIEQLKINDGEVTFLFVDGRTKVAERNFRCGFSKKLVCGYCGNILKRYGILQNEIKRHENLHKWVCKSKRNNNLEHCESRKNLFEDKLRKATKDILGDGNIDSKVVSQIDYIREFDDYLIFIFKDGREIEWKE